MRERDNPGSPSNSNAPAQITITHWKTPYQSDPRVRQATAEHRLAGAANNPGEVIEQSRMTLQSSPEHLFPLAIPEDP